MWGGTCDRGQYWNNGLIMPRCPDWSRSGSASVRTLNTVRPLRHNQGQTERTQCAADSEPSAAAAAGCDGETNVLQGRPVRVILLKARQWGGSTLVQMYLAWMQLVRHQGWNSLICGHLHATSKGIKRMV